MITLGRSLTALATLTILLASPRASAQCTPDTEAPTLIASDISSECTGALTFAFVDPDIEDNCDPLPQKSFDNAFNDVDPDAYPIGQHFVTVTGRDKTGNSRNLTVSVTVADTKPPNVSIGASVIAECTDPGGTPVILCNGSLCSRTCAVNGDCPGTGFCDAGLKCACAGDGDCPAGSNCVGGRCSAPFATDVCTPTSSLIVLNDAPGVYPRGTTPVHITAVDIYGNSGTGTINVVVKDDTAPAITDVYDFAVVQKGDCEVATGFDVAAGTGDGTRVFLPIPGTSDACSFPGEISVSNSIGDTVTSVCLDDPPTPVSHTIVWTVLDGSGNESTASQTVYIVPLAGGVTFTVDGPNGWESSGTADVQVSVTGATPTLTWTATGAYSETAVDGLSHTFFTTPIPAGEYCPLYLSFIDSASPTPTVGVDESVCFAFDKDKPSHDFAVIPTEWVDSVNPNAPAAVDAGDLDTWPVFSHGELLDLRFTVRDTEGPATSGISHVEVVVDPGTSDIVVYDSALTGADCPHPGGVVTSLPSCPLIQAIDGCNNPNSVCQADGRLSLRDLTAGGPVLPEAHVIAVRVTDLAGNMTESLYYIKVGNLSDVLVAEIDWANGLIPLVSIAEGVFLSQAADFFTTANRVLEDSPGHAFLLARMAYIRLDMARGAGAPTEFMQERLARGMVGEARRLLELAVAQGSTDWAILSNPASYPVDPGIVTTDSYGTRSFLIPTGLYQVKVDPTISLAGSHLATAQDDLDRGVLDDGDFFLAIGAAIDTYDAAVMLFTDQILADLYGLAARTIDADPGTLTESYYRGSTPGRFGDTLGKTVAAQITRFSMGAESGQYPGIPAEAVASLAEVRSMVAAVDPGTPGPDSFVDAVDRIKDASWDFTASGFDNSQVTELIYMNAAESLARLREIQGSSVYTHYWQAGISLTVAFVINFSLYEGPASLVEISDDDKYEENFLLLNNGNVPSPNNLDPVAQSAECRFSRFMYALADGRLKGNIESAVDLMVDSKCMVLHLFNAYYSGGRYVVGGDPFIPWARYGCVDPSTAPACTTNGTWAACVANPRCAWDRDTGLCGNVTYATECTCIPGNSAPDNNCNGIDEDCNGTPDDGFVASSCGYGLCISTDACVNGVYAACVPNMTAAVSDANCDGVDQDCDGTPDDNYVPISCGIGGCGDTSECIGGIEDPCTPRTPSAEVCDGVDNNCNWVKDEFLDADQDGYGCNPAFAGCNRMAHCRALTTSGACTAGLGCRWFPAAGVVCADIPDGPTCQGNIGCAWDGVMCSVATADKRCIGDCANMTLQGECEDPSIKGCRWLAGPGPCVSDCVADVVAGQWDCDDTNSASHVGAAEICDYRDNNCNFLIDEDPGVLNDCGNCEPSCESTCYGAGGPECTEEIPFNPTPGNSDSIVQNDCLCDPDCAKPCACNVTPGSCNAGCICDPDCLCECDTTGACDDGSMTVTSTEVNLEFAWVSNNSMGTVSKIDTSTGREVGRYCAALNAAPLDQSGQPRGLANLCGACGGCNSPSRSAVDLKGNVFLGNRAFGYQGSITKLANILLNSDCTVRDPGDCVDFNNNGTIETSCDKNGDGIISTVLANGEYLGQNDECILWTKAPNTWEDGTHEPKGDGYFLPRAVAIDADGDVWVGNWMSAGMFEMDPDTGRVKRWAYMGANPYGAVLDSQGILYVPQSCCGSGYIFSYNTNPAPITMGVTTWAPYGVIRHPVMPRPFGNYGIAVDGRNRVWLGGYNGGGSLVTARFDPMDASWALVTRAQSDGATLEHWLGTTATLSAWIKTTQVGNDTTWLAPGLTGVQQADGNYDVFWGFIDNTGRIGISASTGGRVESVNPINDNTWHHVAMTRNHVTGRLELFVDSVSQGTNMGTPGGMATGFYDFGRIFDTGGSHEEFDGSIDEIRVTSSIRTADWIAAEFLTGSDAFITYGPVENVGAAGWWNNSWGKRLRLTFDNSGQTTTALTNFPVLVVLDTAFTAGFNYSNIATDGADLRFIGAGGIPLAFEIEKWGGAASTPPDAGDPNPTQSLIWVKVPSITAGSSAESISMYYGNAGATDGQDGENVWDAGFELVYHLNHDFAEATDADRDGTGNGGPVAIYGPLGRCYDFDGSDDYVTVFSPAPWLVSAGDGRGVTVDGRGIAWVAQHGGWTGGRLTGYDVDTMQIAVINGREMNFNIAPASIPIGVGIGYGGNVWTANQSSWNMTVLNPQTATIGHYPVGGPTYTYSDFTGNLLKTFTAPQGSYSEVFDGCLGNDVQTWKAVYWEGEMPFETDIGFRVRVAGTQAQLASAPWYPTPSDPDALYSGNPISILEVPAASNGTPGIRWIQVEAILISDEDGHRPTLNWFKVARECLEL